MNSRLKCNSEFKEYLVGSFEAEALSGGVVVAVLEASEAVCGQRIEVGLSGQLTAQPTNRVFDATLLPRRMCVTEPGRDAEPSVQQIVLAEFASVIEGHGLTGAGRHPFHHGAEIVGDRLRRSGFLSEQQRPPRSAFLRHQQELPGFAEVHEVGFPIARTRACLHHRGTVMNGNPIPYGLVRPSAIPPTLSATALLAGQPAMQGFMERPSAPIDVAIDRFVTDPLAGWSPCHPSCNLLGRPSLGEALENFLTKFQLWFELMGSTARMAAPHQLLRPLGIVSHRSTS